MIDPMVFKTSRELARSKLDKDNAMNSFGYWIDVENKWERYDKPAELIDFLSIHRTHAHKLNEFIADAGELSPEESEWMKQYIQLYTNVSRLLATTGNTGDLRHDLLETLVSWRLIKQYYPESCNILDFGAGAARYGVMSYLDHPNTTYTALDATLAAYTLQNMVLSYLDILQGDESLFEYLDYEALGRPLPDLASSSFHRTHIPTWVAKDLLVPKKQDVVVLSHVHGELSKEDFLRMVDFIDISLNDEGIVFVRSELTWGDTRDYWNTVDLHGLELVEELGKLGLLPIHTESLGGYLTTVFAKQGSQHFKNACAKEQTDECVLWELKHSREITLYAARQYTRKHLGLLAKSGQPALIVGNDNPLFEQFDGQSVAQNSSENAVLNETALGQLRQGDSELSELVAENDHVVVLSEQCRSYANAMKIEADLSQHYNCQFAIRRCYPFYGVLILSKQHLLETDSHFDSPIFHINDLK